MWLLHLEKKIMPDNSLSNERKVQIINILEKRGATGPCPRCTESKFTLLDGYFSNQVRVDLEKAILGGPTVPTVVLICNNCGFISQHALGALGLMPSLSKEKQ